DGQSGGFAGRITALGKRSAAVAVLDKLRDLPERSAAPVLFQAVIRRPRLEWLVEKATELDVAAIVPVRSQRIAHPLGRLERLHAIAVEAAEQCGRLDVPVIHGETPLAGIGPLRRPGRPLLVLDPLAEASALDLLGREPDGADLLIGPEGGLAPEDDAVLAGLPDVVRGRLAPTVLRAETAALAALAASVMLRRFQAPLSVESLQTDE
uniref:RsmE family RNA methyltransferase n=1 Tax=Geminicoccus flavidas TaxID=2506407 RepID=UPI001357D864